MDKSQNSNGGDPAVQTSGAGTPAPKGTSSDAAQDAPPGAKKNPAAEALAKAKDLLGLAVRTARKAHVHDLNVIGALENAFEDAKNAVAGNAATREGVQAAAKALELAANALANHSRTTPDELSEIRQGALATKHAWEALK